MKKPLRLAALSVVALIVPASALPGITRPEFQIVDSSPFETLSASSETTNLANPPVPFSITVNFSGDPAFEQSFLDAAAVWEGIIPYYIDGRRNGPSTFTGVTINAAVSPIDGAGNVLGSAGPSSIATDRSGYVMATSGSMTFDSADFSTPTPSFQQVVLHEMAHVIGIGTLWDNNGLYNPSAGSVTDPNNNQTVGQYTGAFGLQGWQAEFDADATYVPVEKGGGSGTADGHWNEGDGGGTTGYISSITGLDARFELMTGWLNSGSFISEVTRGSLRDLGYEVNVIPETGVLLASFLLGGGLMLRRRRHGIGSR